MQNFAEDFIPWPNRINLTAGDGDDGIEGDQRAWPMCDNDRNPAALADAVDCARQSHFAFRIDDYGEARRRLDAAGIAYRELEAPAGGIRQLFLADVNEAVIEVNWRPD